MTPPLDLNSGTNSNSRGKVSPQTSMHPNGASSANRDSRIGFLFGIVLLIIAGFTATFVGFKVKNAEITRTAELMKTFNTLVGDRSKVVDPSKVLSMPGANAEQKVFISAYQLNKWVQSFGLARTLEQLDPVAVVASIEALETIQATEVFKTARETWQLMHAEGSPPLSTETPLKATNQTALRIARRYDRSFSREVAAKLFQYLDTHRDRIVAKVDEISS